MLLASELRIYGHMFTCQGPLCQMSPQSPPFFEKNLDGIVTETTMFAVEVQESILVLAYVQM